MSHEIALKRHYRHDASEQATKRVTATVTGDTSMRHPSPYPSPIKPLDQADRDASDALTHKPGPKQKETTRMIRKFIAVQPAKYEFRDGKNTRDLIAIYSGGKRVCFIEYSAAREFVDQMHDLCDAHEAQKVVS